MTHLVALSRRTRTPRRLRWERTGYAYQPLALGTCRRRRAACAQGRAYCTHWVRVPASAVPYVPRTVAPQRLAQVGWLSPQVVSGLCAVGALTPTLAITSTLTLTLTSTLTQTSSLTL